MDNNPLTPRASNFSIASLITSDGCDDENSLYHSIHHSPTGILASTPIPMNNPNLLFEKAQHDIYSVPLQQDLQQNGRPTTLTETNNGQAVASTGVKENRSTNQKVSHNQVTNLQKTLTNFRNMDGKK